MAEHRHTPKNSLAWSVFPSPIGDLTLVADEHALIRLAFPSDPAASFAEGDSDTADPKALGILRRAETELSEYFAGTRRKFEVPLNAGLADGFSARASRQLELVPYGSQVTYGELAERVGNRKAARAVGTMCAQNPIPIFIPCHRVVRADYSPGQYRGGVRTKRYLLDLEKATDES